MSALKSVVITFPKGFSAGCAISSSDDATRPKLNFDLESARMDAKKMPKQEETCQQSEVGTTIYKTDFCLRGKKRRLDHLTWEEKLQRKKLKNRVAAQTSRDRKKAKLDELEETVRILKERNDILIQECTILRSQNESLIVETKRLRKEDVKATGEQFCSMCQARVGCAVPSLGSAVSPQNPLPQGGTAQLAQSLTPGAAILLKILTLYLLSKNCLANSKETITSNDSKNWQKAFCERLPRKWKEILKDQMNKCQSRKIPLKNLTIQKEWWGRHQKMWKPMQPLVEA